MSKINVNQVDTQCGSTLTLGSSGKTVTLASGASQSGFGRTGTVDWCTTAKTSPFTSVSGNGYFVNTTSSAITVTLPAGSAGDIISLKDYANTWDTNNVTVTPNETDKINGLNGNAILNTEDQSVTIVYVDSTKGWRVVQDSTSSVDGSDYITATGGTVVTNGDFKTHVFTSDGTFCVSAGGGPLASVEYFVVAGGGSGGTGRGGGGGAGGFRLYTTAPGSNSPLNHPSNLIPLTVQGYPVTVGGGGSALTFTGTTEAGNNGSNSIFSTITSAGGGGGGGGPTPGPALSKDGGSGGGGNFNVPGDFGAGNTPPVSPPQGNNGSVSCSAAPSSPGDRHGGGGGGAGSSGGCGSNHENGGAGSYIANPLVGPTAPSYGTPGPESGTRYFAGGGGAGFEASNSGPGGVGGGGAGNNTTPATDGTANTGGGGGGVGENNPSTSGAGGSGIVMIRYRFQ